VVAYACVFQLGRISISRFPTAYLVELSGKSVSEQPIECNHEIKVGAIGYKKQETKRNIILITPKVPQQDHY